MVSVTAQGLRIAFFITSYRSPAQLNRLVNTLRRGEPNSPIVIHHDSFRSSLDLSQFDTISDLHILNNDRPIVWGDMSLETTRWRVFRWILKNIEVDWIMLLSEQDYPIAPLQNLRVRLAESGVDAFISGQRIDEIEDIRLYGLERGGVQPCAVNRSLPKPATPPSSPLNLGERSQGNRRLHLTWRSSVRHSPLQREDPDMRLREECIWRYLYRYANLPSLKIEHRLPDSGRKFFALWRHRFCEAVNRSQQTIHFRMGSIESRHGRIGLRQRKTPFNSEFPCWMHSSWYALSRKALQHVVDYVDSHSDFVRYYDRTEIPVESATGTIVFNDPDLRVANVSLHAIRWTNPQTGRPDVFRWDDLDFLHSTDAVFARKFDERDVYLLNELDSAVFRDFMEAP